MKQIVWLASYPKSGNTWFRVFLANLIRNEDGPLDINHIARAIPNAASRTAFDEELGFDSHDLSFKECDRLRPDYYRFIACKTGKPVFLKVHDAFSVTDEGRFLIPRDATRCIVYLIRNPLDVVVSFANHSGRSLDQSIDFINSETGCLAGERCRSHIELRQRLFCWSTHVKSWTENTRGFDVHAMRYEDMKTDPELSFGQAVRFIGIKVPRDRFLKSLDYSCFDELKKQEISRGFQEKPIQCGSFFNKGEAGSWRRTLSDNQVQRVIECHMDMMTRFGYLKSGEPAY